MLLHDNTRPHMAGLTQLMLTTLKFEVLIRVANITDFSVEVRNSENDPYFSRFLYGVLTFSDFLRILQFFNFFQHFSLSINTYGGTKIPVFRRCLASIIEYAVRIFSIIKK